MGSPSLSVRQQKEIKSLQIVKEEVKLSLFSDHMILYIENLKDSTKKLLELIHKFSNVIGYKICVQKPVAFLYTNNEAAEVEIKESILFTIAPNPGRYIEINLMEEVKDVYSVIYVFKNNPVISMKNRIKKEFGKWEDMTREKNVIFARL